MNDNEHDEMDSAADAYSSDIVFIEGGAEAGVYLCADDAEAIADLLGEMIENRELLAATWPRLEKLFRRINDPDEALFLTIADNDVPN